MLETTKGEKSEIANAILLLESRMTSLSEKTELPDMHIPVEDFAPDEQSITRDAYTFRRSMITVWRKSLNERKQAYWNYLKFTNTSVIYDTWLGKEQPVLPRKYRPNVIPGEHNDDKEIRKENAIYAFEADIKIMNKSRRYEESFLKIDEEMIEIIKRKSLGEVCEKVIEIWRTECEKEETVSADIWMKKQVWLENYEEDFGSDIFVDEEKITQIYRRPNISEMNSRESVRTGYTEKSSQNQNGLKTHPNVYNAVRGPHSIGIINLSASITQADNNARVLVSTVLSTRHVHIHGTTQTSNKRKIYPLIAVEVHMRFIETVPHTSGSIF